MPAGTVTEFDEAIGLGVVTGDDGARHRFHCIEIADGTRTIAVGTRVAFDVLARFGEHQAGRLRPA